MPQVYTIGVLIPIWNDAPSEAPDQRPLGRLAMEMEPLGVSIIFGHKIHAGALSGWRASGKGWSPVEGVPLDAVYDRFPSQTHKQAFEEMQCAAGDIPWCNPPGFTDLCRDKWLLQRHMETGGIKMPDCSVEVETFDVLLKDWGAAFLKPRFGSFGRGVQYVRDVEALQSAQHMWSETFGSQMVLQRAVPPPDKWAGVSVRILCQRNADGKWITNPGVVRRSASDPVVNAARGANLCPLDRVVDATSCARVDALMAQVCARISELPDSAHILEMGVDVVLDDKERPHLIEINGRPRGRLASLARQEPKRFKPLHRAVVRRPFERILRLIVGGL